MSILNDMGNTPLVKLKNPFGDNYAQVYLKMEELESRWQHKITCCFTDD